LSSGGKTEGECQGLGRYVRGLFAVKGVAGIEKQQPGEDRKYKGRIERGKKGVWAGRGLPRIKENDVEVIKKLKPSGSTDLKSNQGSSGVYVGSLLQEWIWGGTLLQT